MSAEFIKQKTGSNGITLATKQQDQLSYFTQSTIQEEINLEYITKWANRKYITNDFFLNWVKAVFKTENFLAFFKHLRKPLPSARLVNDRLNDQLARVFHAEDSYCKYIIKGQEIEAPEVLDIQDFNNKLFNALLFSHNDILIHDLRDVNTPFRHFVSIKKVVAIESHDSVISRVAFSASIEVNGVLKTGFLFLDKFNYIFYDRDFTALLTVPHDLGVCPADYISKDPFSLEEEDSIRKSIFSYVREELEEYNFLKTLQRMTEINGAIPVIAMLNFKEKSRSGEDKDGAVGEPMSSRSITGQQAENGSDIINGGVKSTPFQAGSTSFVPVIKKEDGSLDMEVVKNFINYYHAPIEAFEYLNKRIKEIEKSITIDVIGAFTEGNELQKNKFQIANELNTKQDKLRSFSNQLSRIRNLSDFKMLALQNGKEAIEVDCFMGSDFFLESQADLYDLFENSPNTIERKNILVRLSQNRNKFNPNRAKREKLLYDLLPYSSDIDFDKAIERGIVDDIIFLYQTQFSYWIDQFEANFGDIVFFHDLIDGEESEKLLTINNLIINIIKEYYEQSKESGTLTGVQSVRAIE